jgi:BirA family biotin operon repressor/biotin-[acetyl-CoA-carboxylase] ligase
MTSDATPPLHWGVDALWRQLSPLWPGLSVEVLARCESTNTALLDRCRLAGASRADDTGPARGRRSDDAQPCLLVAETQTRGRGRLGRGWVSGPGTSLTFSLAMPLAPQTWSGLSLAVGCALADALDPPAAAATPPRIALKWPNDLWLWDGPGRGRKLGGILIETVPVGALRMLVAGVGINVQPLPGPTPPDLEHGHASLAELGPDASAPDTLARIARPLVQALQRFERDGLAPFLDAWARRDLLAGQAVVTRGATPPHSGVCEGVAPDGALRLRRPDGGLQTLVSGEVSVRLQPDGAGATDATPPC